METSAKKPIDSENSTQIIPSVVSMVISPQNANKPSIIFSDVFKDHVLVYFAWAGPVLNVVNSSFAFWYSSSGSGM